MALTGGEACGPGAAGLGTGEPGGEVGGEAGGDQGVQRSDPLTRLLEVGANLGCGARFVPAEGNHLGRPEQRVELLPPPGRCTRPEDPNLQFVEHDCREHHLGWVLR